MPETTITPRPPEQTGSPAGDGLPAAVRGRTTRRVIGLSLWSAAFVAAWFTIGLPTEPVYLFGWLWAATIAWRSHEPWRVHLRFVRDWAPVVVLLVGYNLSRGFARTTEPHVTELIVADEWLFGWLTGGQVPTLWLQQHLYDPAQVRWWDVIASWVYFSHFVLAIGVALVLWLRDRQRWAAFMRRFLFLCAAGLATYFAYPAAPPWWAYEQGYLPEVVRISTRGWSEIGLHAAFNALNSGQLASNPVAAMPSLHTAWALLVVVFFLPRVARRWWPLLLAYPLAMTFTLVYTGEHYVIDVLAGWAYVAVTLLVVGGAERWWRRRRATASGNGTAAGDDSAGGGAASADSAASGDVPVPGPRAGEADRLPQPQGSG